MKNKTCDMGHEMELDWDICPYCIQQQHPRKTRMRTISRRFGRKGGDVCPRVLGWLLTLSHPHTNERFPLFLGDNICGIHRGCDIVIDHPDIRERHINIRGREDGKVDLVELDPLVDASKSSGTKGPLDEGDLITIGPFEFRLMLASMAKVVGLLILQNGHDEGEAFVLLEGKNLIGSADTCDVRVSDPYLAATHSLIAYKNNGFVFMDLDSPCGSFLNGKRAVKSELTSGDVLRLGKSELLFESWTTRSY